MQSMQENTAPKAARPKKSTAHTFEIWLRQVIIGSA